MADHCDCTTRNFHQQLPIALAKVKPSTCSKVIAKVVKQEEKYWAEDAQLYESEFDEMADLVVGEDIGTVLAPLIAH